MVCKGLAYALDSRLRGNDGVYVFSERRGYAWIPAFAGMTAVGVQGQAYALDSRLRGNDGIYVFSERRGYVWIPAFAGMTDVWGWLW